MRKKCQCLIPFWLQVQGDNSSDRDLGAVQRGDAEMEQKMNRALRACLERSSGNPICSIHDQGAGGNGMKTRSFFIKVCEAWMIRDMLWY